MKTIKINSKILKFLLFAFLFMGSQMAISQDATPESSQNFSPRLNKFGVPQYELYRQKVVNGKRVIYKIDSIPKLNLGSEKKFNGYTTIKGVSEIRNLKVPDLLVLTQPIDLPYQSPQVENPQSLSTKDLVSDMQLDKIKPVEITPIATAVKAEQAYNESPIKELTPIELKMLQAFIFYEVHENYEFSLALAEDLKNEPSVKNDVTYLSGMSGYKLKLNTLYKDRITTLLNQTQSDFWVKKSLETFVRDAHKDEIDLVPFLQQKIKQTKSESLVGDKFNFNIANYELDQNQLEASLQNFEKIPTDSVLKAESLFYKGLILYRLGKVDQAVAHLNEISSLNPDQNLKSSAALTLARIYFEQAKYKEAIQNFLLVDKSHPDWMQAMIELSWAQILDKNYEGAAGNMFAIHTDVFKHVYSPESYLSRSVSYINLCQYGDGFHVIKDLEDKYSPIHKVLDKYQKLNSQPQNYYDTVRRVLLAKDKSDVDGLPQEFVIQWAKYPVFENLQRNLNSKEDEIQKLNTITLDILKKEKYFKQKTAEIAQALKNSKTPLEKDRERLLAYQIQTHIAQKTRNSIKNIRAEFVPKIETEKNKIKISIAIALKKHFDDLKTQLDQFMDEVDVVKYEIFSGAGEHLRYQMAGGEINAPKKENLNDQNVKWNFNGEVWEDELGNYRSSLKNVCAKEDE